MLLRITIPICRWTNLSGTDIIQLVSLVILILLSAFFSSAETALVTVNRIKMWTLADEGNVAKRVLAITDHSSKMLSAILPWNNIVNLSGLCYFYSTLPSAFSEVLLPEYQLNFNCFDSDFVKSPKTIATIHSETGIMYSGVVSFL